MRITVGQLRKIIREAITRSGELDEIKDRAAPTKPLYPEEGPSYGERLAAREEQIGKKIKNCIITFLENDETDSELAENEFEHCVLVMPPTGGPAHKFEGRIYQELYKVIRQKKEELKGETNANIASAVYKVIKPDWLVSKEGNYPDFFRIEFSPLDLRGVDPHPDWDIERQ